MENYKPRLQALYQAEIVPKLMEEFGYKNIMEVPRLVKISVNKGLGEAPTNKKILTDGVEELRKITGQHPVVRNARKSVSNFKLRQGMAIGVSVTLRSSRMWEFMDRLVTLALPRVRDFRGIPDKSFDGRGNYTLGIKEQIIFPEIVVDQVERINGMDISFVTTANTDAEGLSLLKHLGMPFVRREQEAPAETEA